MLRVAFSKHSIGQVKGASVSVSVSASIFQTLLSKFWLRCNLVAPLSSLSSSNMWIFLFEKAPLGNFEASAWAIEAHTKFYKCLF